MGLPTRNGRGVQPQRTTSGGVRPEHRRSNRADRSEPPNPALAQRIVRRLTGYDPATELLAYKRDIPDDNWDEAKRIARVPVETETGLGSFPITDDTAQKVAALLDVSLPDRRMDYFLEPFAVPAPKQLRR